VNAAILTTGGGGSVGIGFAIPSNTMREVVPRLERGRAVRHAYLGVKTSEFQSGPGAYVADVTPGAPASAAGLKVGDVIVGVGGATVTIPDDISTAIQDRKPGERIAIEVDRAGARRTLRVTLGDRPASSGTGYAPTTP
jgi:putative serine protease PepD